MKSSSYLASLVAGVFIISNFILADTDNRVKIAIIDSGIEYRDELKPYLCKTGHKNFTSIPMDFKAEHGTNISAIIAQRLDANRECIIMVKYYDPYASDDVQADLFVQAVKYVSTLPIKFLNLSVSGKAKSDEERLYLQKMLDNDVRIIVSAGNNNQDLTLKCNIYPACYYFGSPLFHVVANGKKTAYLTIHTHLSNWGGPVTDWAWGVDVKAGGYTMSGTSQAAAIVTGKLVEEYRRYKEMIRR